MVWGRRDASVLSCLVFAAAVGAWLALAAGPAAAESAGNRARGQELYQKLCVTCHGVYGRGDGPQAKNLGVPLPDLTLPSTLEPLSDAQLMKLLRYGPESKHTPMVVSQALNREALQDVIAYLRTLYVPGKHVSVYAGRDIYESVCWTCHGRNGNGDGPSAKLIEGTKPRNFRSPEFHIKGREAEVRRTITEGGAKSFHGSKYMLEWGTKLSKQQIEDVMAFLETFKSGSQQQAAH